MLTVSHIATTLQHSHHPSTAIVQDPCVYCIYCGVQLANVTRGIPSIPLVCPLYLQDGSGDAWRACAECANIAGSLWYYAGYGRTAMPRPKLRGAALDIYVWLLRESPQDDWSLLKIPLVASRLRYSRGAISSALARLLRRGYLERQRVGRYSAYRPLIWQRPKGE
jgi:hypothetical protein